MVGIITTPEAEIEQKREVKLTNGSGVPTQGSTAAGFSEVVAEFVVPSEQRSGVGVTVPVQMTMPLKPWGAGTVKWVKDTTADDSDKSFTVPTGKIWDMQMLFVDFRSSATVGNRLLHFVVTDGTNTLYVGYSSLAIAASKETAVIHYFNSSITAGALTAAQQYLLDGTTVCDQNAQIAGAPRMLLPAGYVLRVKDAAAVDAAADDMVVVLHYIEYDA